MRTHVLFGQKRAIVGGESVPMGPPKRDIDLATGGAREMRESIVRMMRMHLASLEGTAKGQGATRFLEGRIAELKEWIAKLGVVLFAFLLLSPAAQAEMLLLELSWSQPEPVTLPVQYSVHVEDSGFFPNHGGWLETVFEWPHQSFADEATVRALNLPMIESSQDPLIIFYVVDDHISGAGQQQTEGGRLGCNTCDFSRLMGQPDEVGDSAYWMQRVAEEGWEVDLQVPLLGDTGLKGYWLTNVERLATAEKQTIRFYGNVIPEPASWVLVLFGLTIHWRKR